MAQLSETPSKNLLVEYSIPTPEGRNVTTVEAAIPAADDLGYPLVLKVEHPNIAHKSDIGGVVIGISNSEQLQREAQRLLALGKGASLRLECMASDDGIDLILGFKRDPLFGPVLLVGTGGVYAEILSDTVLYVGKPDRHQAKTLLQKLRCWPMLMGARGQAGIDIESMSNAMVSLMQLAGDHPEITEFDINPLRASTAGVIALDALAIIDDGAAQTQPQQSARINLQPLFRPKSVAVIGPSTSSERAGNIILKNLATFGFPGKVFPVNPNGGVIEGHKAYKSLNNCPEPPEVAVLAVPANQVMTVMHDVAAAGIGYVIIASGGFADAGSAGQKRELELMDFCQTHNIRVMGPNSIGTVDSVYGFCTSIGKLPPMTASGVSIFGQSGTFSTGFALEEITRHGRGYSKIACMGNKADINECDFLDHYASDDDTNCIGMYLEGVSDGPRFASSLDNAASSKPVIILKSGRTALGAAAAASHTGSMAGEDAIFNALFDQAGCQRVDDFTEFFGALRAFDLCPLPKEPRLGIVSITGLGCVLAADACGTHGLEVAKINTKTKQALQAQVPEWAPIGNPADIWSTIEQRGPAEAYGCMSEIMLGDDQVDILLVIAVLLEEGAFDAKVVFDPIRRKFPDKPILACCLGGRRDLLQNFRMDLESVGIPVYDGPDLAIKMAAMLYHRKIFLEPH